MVKAGLTARIELIGSVDERLARARAEPASPLPPQPNPRTPPGCRRRAPKATIQTRMAGGEANAHPRRRCATTSQGGACAGSGDRLGLLEAGTPAGAAPLAGAGGPPDARHNCACDLRLPAGEMARTVALLHPRGDTAAARADVLPHIARGRLGRRSRRRSARRAWAAEPEPDGKLARASDGPASGPAPRRSGVTPRVRARARWST